MLDCLSKTCCSDSSLGEIGEDEVAEEPGAFEDCWMSEERGCDLSYLRNTSQSRSSWIVYPPDLTCYDGEPYGFQVFPGPSNGRLLVWLQGGGGCTNYETCEVPDTSTAITSLFPNTKGLFDMSRGADNPVISGGWTVVVVNYCSGDSHVGNATAELVSWDGASSANVTFSGARHVDRVLEWVAAQDFGTGPSARRLAGGCSAGSLGVQSWMYALRQRVGVTGFLFDSYVGILPPDLGAALRDVLGACSSAEGPMQWPEEWVERCEQGEAHEVPEFTVDALAGADGGQSLYVGWDDDVVQRSYYSIVSTRNASDKEAYVRAAGVINREFTGKLEEILAGYENVSLGFSSVLFSGQDHCVVPFAKLYDTSLRKRDSNATALEVIDRFLNGELSAGEEVGSPAGGGDGPTAGEEVGSLTGEEGGSPTGGGDGPTAGEEGGSSTGEMDGSTAGEEDSASDDALRLGSVGNLAAVLGTFLFALR
eukprot:CAMPEP_0177614064 /NCGR_PEP_ID=MMETSP0419_2-20121207/22412_1 /TAXON_ID=582737 /ORGANISM="Tetraselmis sp., Strain GSL018" /LENGTH=479 /DNA_ID=CAMNT_0019111009 /DNA_START=427 /DNA_END=1866 /DNA_ORIENTATION=+